MLEGLQLTRKAARAGFDWQDAGGIFEKLREEMAEVRHALDRKECRKRKKNSATCFSRPSISRVSCRSIRKSL